MPPSRLVAALVPLILFGISPVFPAANEPLEPPRGRLLPDELARSLERNSGQYTPICLTYTYQLRSLLNAAESLQRLNLANASQQDQIFLKHKYRVCHNANKFRFTMWTLGDAFDTVAYESSFDGKTAYDINYPAASGGALAQLALNLKIPLVAVKQTVAQLKRKTPPAPIPAMLRERRKFYLTAACITYNKHGLNWNTPRIESPILAALRDGGSLVSVQAARKDGQEHIRVEIRCDNPLRQMALDVDLDRLEQNRAFKAETAERRIELKAIIEKQRKLPPFRTYVYYLDPKSNYAVRTAEEWYDPGILLKRTECLGLVRVPGRDVFLPTRCHTSLHEFPTMSASTVEGAFLSEEWELLDFRGDQIDDQQFVLDSTDVPGAIVQDGTLTRADNSSKPVIFTVPERPEALQRVIADAVNDPRDVAMPLGYESFGRSRSSAQAVFLIGNGVLLATLALYWLLRRLTQRHETT